MTLFLRFIGISGVILFGAFMAFIVAKPDSFERTSLSFIKGEVISEVLQKYPDLAEGPLDGVLQEGLGRLSDRIGIKQNDLSALAASEFPDVLGHIVESFCTCGPVDAEDAKIRSAMIREGLEARAAKLGLDQAKLIDFMKGQYAQTLSALRGDLMLFLSVNTLSFALVVAATFVPRSRRHAVVVPAMLLISATLARVAIYVMGTDWFYAIIFQDYAGVWYAIGLSVIYAFLADIVLNRAKVTLKLLSQLPAAIPVPVC